jgi:hypothetical protein
MGGGEQDNFIITDVYTDTLIYQLIAINGNDPNALGELTDFSLMHDNSNLQSPEARVSCWPNPVGRQLHVLVREPAPVEYLLTDLGGKEMRRGAFLAGAEGIIPMDNCPPGVYILQLGSGVQSYRQKIVKL